LIRLFAQDAQYPMIAVSVVYNMQSIGQSDVEAAGVVEINKCIIIVTDVVTQTKDIVMVGILNQWVVNILIVIR